MGPLIKEMRLYASRFANLHGLCEKDAEMEGVESSHKEMARVSIVLWEKSGAWKQEKCT